MLRAAEPGAEPASPFAKWEKDIAAFAAADAKSPPPQGAVLFAGSSSMRLWKTLAEDFPELTVVNRGFGGSRIADSTHFAEQLILKHKPRAIVLYAGDNDLAGGKSPAQVRDDFRAFVKTVHAALPQTKIIYVAVKPSPSRQKLLAKQREFSALIEAEIRASDKLAYCDIFGPMLDDKGQPRPELFKPDMLHMNEKGYAIWIEKLRPMLAEYTKAPSETNTAKPASGEGDKQGALLETQELFTSGEGGYALYRIPGLIVTARGTLLAYCEARKGERGDWGTIDLLLRRSTDGGRTWSDPQKLAEPPSDWQKNPLALKQKLGAADEVTLNNPLLIADRTLDVVHALYCVEYNRCFYRRSDDDGKSFGAPVEITATFEKFRPHYAWQTLATGPAHGLQLSGKPKKDGRLVVPVWLSTGEGGHAHRPSCVATIYSDDNGRTWECGEIAVPHAEGFNPSETVVVELGDGKVLLNFRHEGKPALRGVITSADGATGWTKLRYDKALPEPVCMGSIVRVQRASEKPLIAFANLHNSASKERKNLTVKLSRDDAQTWPHARTLEPGSSGYSDLAATADGTIYCLFERGASGNAFRPRGLTLAKFNAAWVAAGASK